MAQKCNTSGCSNKAAKSFDFFDVENPSLGIGILYVCKKCAKPWQIELDHRKKENDAFILYQLLEILIEYQKSRNRDGIRTGKLLDLYYAKTGEWLDNQDAIKILKESQKVIFSLRGKNGPRQFYWWSYNQDISASAK